MLFEGYFQKLCENGHLTHEDVYATESKNCPECGGEIFKIKKIRTCGHCGSVLEVIYKQPKRKK